MSTEYANLGFRVDSSGLMTADQRLKNVTQSGKKTESQIGMLSKTVGVAAAAFATFNASMSVKNTIFGFDTALKGLQATTRATASDMAKLEAQARQLGATSKFSATEAAEAQRFLAMAGFDTNKILASTPSVLKLATAGEISLAQAADMASNALGGMQLPVEELDRVIDVMAETAASANTNITQMADALSYAAPLAVSAGISVEEAAAAIGKLSDNGLQGSRAGTGLLGVIRQLSKPSSEAAKTLNAYGLTLSDVNIKSRGLANVLKSVNDAGLDTAAMFTVFGSEAAPAAGILASTNEELVKLTERLGNATGSANEMSNIMAGSLTAGALGLGSALQEVSLQIGDAGVAGGMKEAMLAATGFVHVFTGMLPEFAAANNLTADYVSNLNDVADIATIATGALGGLLGLMLTTKVATLGAASAMWALNAVILANPFVLAVSAIAAITGALYAARNMSVEFGGETVKVRDIVVGAFDAISDGFNYVYDASIYAYDSVSQFFTGISENSSGTANEITSSIGGSFSNIYTGSIRIVNGVIATFVTLGKSIGIIAASVTTAFSNSFDNVKNLGEALKKDLDAVLSGDFGVNNLKSAIENAFTNPLKMTFSELGKAAADSFNTDYIGNTAKELTSIVGEVSSGFQLYTIAARNTRVENEKLGKSNKDLAADIEWVLSELDKLNSIGGKSQSTGGGLVGGMSEDLDSLIDQVDNFGGAWTRTGNVMVDAFGNAADAMQDYMSRMKGIDSLQDKINKERSKQGADNVALDELQMKVNQERQLAEISGYRATANAAMGMFSEKTAAYKAFSAVNQALSLIEIALNFQKIASGTAATTAHVAQEGTKQGANALTAITSAFAAPFPVNFVAGAAMIGIMASLLGGAFGGGGGGSYEMPETGGTGTVLGDSSAQSSSISNASERLEDIQIDQLSELMTIRQSMSQLSSGIQNLAKSFATDLDFNSASGELENSNFLDTKLGGILRKIDPIARAADWIDKLTGGLLGLGGVVDKIFGGFSSKKQKLIDSGITFVSQTMQDVFESGNLDASMFQVIETTKKKFWGLSKKTSTNTETSGIGGTITSQMADIFGYIGDTVVAAAESLGADTKHIITTGLELLSLDEALAGFVIDIGDVSFADKTGEEIQKELEAIFSQQADLMAQYLVPSITEYQQVGEGAFETLQRVAYEQAVFNDALDRTGVSLKDLSNIMQIDIAQSIISLIGGVEQFSELANSFFDNFYSEAEQFNYLQSSISDVFSELGIGMVASRDEFRNLVEGIDLTTDSGQQLYASLMQINPAMAEYFNALDDLARDKLGLQIDLLNAQGKSEEALAMQRKIELESLDESLRSLQLQVWAQQDLNAEREAEIKAMEEMRSTLESNVTFAEQQLEKARQAEIARINSTVEAAENAYNSTLESINLQREAYNKLIDELQSSVDAAASNLQASLNAELSKYDDLISASKERASEEISLINSISSARVSALSSELSLISSIASQYGASSVGVSASEALRAARRGNFEPATRVKTDGNFANATEARISKAREDFALSEIGKLADAQMSDLERTISATESSAQSQIYAINAAADKEVAELEAQRAEVEEQIKGILGITDTVLSLDEATAQYQKAQDDLQNALAEGTLDKLQAQENIALQSLEQAREDAQKQIDALNEQVDSLLNIDNSVSSVDEAIKLLLAERKELAEFEKTMQESQLETQVETLQAVLSVESAINESTKVISDMYKDIVLVNKEPPNEIPPPVVYSAPSGNDKMSQEIKSMKEAMESQNRSIAKSSATTAKILQRIELGGLEIR